MTRRIAIVFTLMTACLAASLPAAAREGYLIDFNALVVVDTANPSIVARVPLGGHADVTPVVDPLGARVYVVRRKAPPFSIGVLDDVAVVDTASRTVVSTIPVRFPQEVLLSPQGGRLYVTTQGAPVGVPQGGVSVVDTATNAVIGGAILAPLVGPMAVDISGARLYVALDQRRAGVDPPAMMAVLDGSSGAVLSKISLQDPSAVPFAVAVHPDGSRVYAANRGDLLVVEPASGVAHEIALPVPPPPMHRALTAMLVDPAGEFVLVFGLYAVGPEINGTVASMIVVDARTALVVGEMSLPLVVEAGAIHRDGRTFVTGRPLGTCGARTTGCSKASAGVAVIDVAARRLLAHVDTGQPADAGISGMPPASLFPPAWEGVQVHPDGASVYVAERNGRLSVLDAATGAIVAQVPGAGIALGSGPPPVPGRQQLYIMPSSGIPPAAIALGAPGDHPVPRDYDGDGWIDLAVWRPRDEQGEGVWLIRRSSDGVLVRQPWGAAAFGDVPVPADYDGDGRIDVAVWRPFQGGFYVVRSSDGSAFAQAWGGFGDVPVPADYDGDGRADLAIWRPGVGDEPSTWFILNTAEPPSSIQLGEPTDLPVPADYDGDGRADPAVWRPTTGEWFVHLAGTQHIMTVFGEPGDVPVPADYDGDGRADFAVWRPRTGEWFIKSSRAIGVTTRHWGAPGDRPLPADYDGDGRADPTVYRP